MTDDDLDLTAWEAPPPPELADAVIARLRDTTVVGAVGAVEPTARAGRRWWWLGGLTAALAAAIALIVVLAGGADRAGLPFGAAGGLHATHVELAGATAELDAGAAIAWHREPDGLHVTQIAGSATWRVEPGAHVWIDTGVAGTSVQASGASLRVEAPMNISDAKLIGTSALTATVVALVTVVVYDGHVRATSDGRSVVVEPGATVALGSGLAPAPATRDDDLEALRQRVDQLEHERSALQQQVAALGGDHVQPIVPDGAVMHALRPSLDGCAAADDFVGTLSLRFEVEHGVVTSVQLQTTDGGSERLLPCVRDAVDALTGVPDGKYAAQLPFGAAPKTACDAEKLTSEGQQAESIGDHVNALRDFAQAYACKPSNHGNALVFMAACNAKDLAKARDSYRRLDTDQQDHYDVLCIRNGITMDDLEGVAAPAAKPCDAEHLKTEGQSAMSVGNHAEALRWFEKAHACKPDAHTAQLVFMEACNAGNLPAARTAWTKLSADAQEHFDVMCIRRGITREMLESKATAEPTTAHLSLHTDAPAEVYIDGADTGKKTPVELAVTPGKHKITFEVGSDRYTYAVTVDAGQTATVSKTLR